MQSHRFSIMRAGFLVMIVSLMCGQHVARVSASSHADGRQSTSTTTAKPTTAKPTIAKPTTVLFMCPHGVGKSVIASAYFQRAAKERGLNVRVDAAGIEAGEAVPPPIASHLRQQGYAVPISKPRVVTAKDLEAADVVISLGCDLKGLPVRSETLEKWDDVPGPSEDPQGADEAIRRRVTALVEELAARQRQ